MNEPKCRGGISSSLTKLLAALANHLEHLTTEHQRNSEVLIDALEAMDRKTESVGEGSSVVENVSLVQAYQGLDAMEQRLEFLCKTIHSVNEIVKSEICENYPDTFDGFMLDLAKNTPITTDGKFYHEGHEPEEEVVEFISLTDIEESVTLFDSDDADISELGKER